MTQAYEKVVALARRQDDMVTRRHARQLGMSDDAITLRRRRHGWSSPIRGTLLIPPVRDELRARARAALTVAGGTICGRTAARLHSLPGLMLWRPDEPVDVALSGPGGYRQRAGCRRHWIAVRAAETIDLQGIRTTTVERTLEDLAVLFDRELFICCVDALLHQRRLANDELSVLFGRLAERRYGERVLRWRSQIDGRSESPLETRVRLLLGDAGLAPEELQWLVRDPATGSPIARIDLAWPSLRVAIEMDGVGPHGNPEALHRDRRRQNALMSLAWEVLRFTWWDATSEPARVTETVRGALTRARVRGAAATA